MAAGDTYLLKTVVFTPSGGSAITIDGIEDVQVRNGAQVVAHGADALFTVLAHFVDQGEGEITVRTRNQSHLINANMQPGAVGALVLTYQKRKAGKGAVSGQDRTITAAGAMVGETGFNVPHSDRGECTIPFHCSDAAGSAVFAFGGPA